MLHVSARKRRYELDLKICLFKDGRIINREEVLFDADSIPDFLNYGNATRTFDLICIWIGIIWWMVRLFRKYWFLDHRRELLVLLLLQELIKERGFCREVVPVFRRATRGVYNEMVQQLKGRVDNCENGLKLL
jgi:hypothetical protein